MKKSRLRYGLIAILAVVFIISVGMTVYRNIQYKENDKSVQNAKALVQSTSPAKPPEQTAAPTTAPEEESQPQPEEGQEQEPPDEYAIALSELNLSAIQAENEDIVGWIEIPDTSLSYPLLQGEDNQYYLTHTWDKEPNIAGSVFLESTSSRDFSDYHIIVYAHRMADESMFGIIKYYANPEFWEQHPKVYIATGDAVYRYEIFAAQEAVLDNIIYRLDISEKGLEEEFLQSCIENSLIDTGITPAPEDQILTLSTCTGIGHYSRWVVHGVLSQVYEYGGAG